MPFVVTESCIKCKYTDCVNVCPMDCFVEGPNFLVIDPTECIDCSVYHRRIGESCDYIAMKREMAESLVASTTESWFDFDFDLSWIELPSIDWSIFDFFD